MKIGLSFALTVVVECPADKDASPFLLASNLVLLRVEGVGCDSSVAITGTFLVVFGAGVFDALVEAASFVAVSLVGLLNKFK